MEKKIRDDLDAAEGRRLWDGDEEGEEDPLFLLLQQFGSLLRSEAFPSLLYARGEWVYEEGGKGSGSLFIFIVDVLRRLTDYVFFASFINVNVDIDIMAPPSLTNPAYLLFL